jgi:hypothetical protein
MGLHSLNNMRGRIGLILICQLTKENWASHSFKRLNQRAGGPNRLEPTVRLHYQYTSRWDVCQGLKGPICLSD